MTQNIDWLIVEPTGIDDTANINAALATLETNGGELRLRAGTYILSSSITPRSGVSFVGIRPKLTFGANCPDLNFTLSGGTVLKASTTGLTCFAGNNIDSPGAELDPLSNIRFRNFGIKGFAKPFDVGAKDQIGFGMGGFKSVYIDGTGDDNVSVQTEQAFELTNCQQMTNSDIMIYKVRNGIKIINDHDTPACSSGNSKWEKPYIYLDPAVTSEGNANISTITIGATTRIEFDADIVLELGDIIQLDGVTGTHASIMNRVHKVETIAGLRDITVDTNTLGKTVVSTGTIEKGRVGIHLISRGVEPLNHVNFIAPQVNAFIASEQKKAICNIALCGVGASVIGACGFIATDTEGKTDNHFYLDGTSDCRIDIATVNEDPSLGHVSVYNTNVMQLNSSNQNVDLKIGDITQTGGGSSDGTSNITVDGIIQSLIANSRQPTGGVYLNASLNKSFIAASSTNPALEFDATTGTSGPSNVNDTWAPLRLMTKRASTKFTGDLTLSTNRCGYLEATNVGNATLTLPAIGITSGKVPVGTTVVVNKVSGAGTVTVAPNAADTIATVANYTAIGSTAGKSVTLMSGGYNDWVVVGSN